MGDKTGIGWTNATWNPVTGCSHVSDGCKHCYAETLSLRFGWSKKPWTAVNAKENVILHPERLEIPIRWQKPRMIFVNSMSDLFHELVPDEFIEQVFSVMALAERHTFQILTKRPKRMMEWCDAHYPYWDGRLPGWDGSMQMPLPDVWLGTSIENQRAADERLPYLQKTCASVRFLSCEPLLEQVDLKFGADLDDVDPSPLGSGVDWVICGGESGSNFRPMNLDWARSLRDQCQEWDIPYFFKQVGGRTPKTGGRLLDGREWNEYPAA